MKKKKIYLLLLALPSVAMAQNNLFTPNNNSELRQELIQELTQQGTWDTIQVINKEKSMVNEKRRDAVTNKITFEEKNLIKDQKQILALINKENRAKDPFGLSFTGKIPKPTIIEPLPGEESEIDKPPAIPTLAQAASTLKIQGVMPKRKEFMVEGGRNIFEGDKIVLYFQKREYRVRVSKVEPHQITLRSRTNGETTILPLNIIPKGLNFGNKTQTNQNTLDSFLTPMEPVNPIK